MSVLNQIREACRQVAENGSYVRIDRDRLRQYAATLPTAALTAPVIDPRYHFLGHGPETVAYILTLDAINFGSGYSAALRKRSGLRGYFTIASALRDRFEAKGPFSAKELTRLHAGTCAALLGQEANDPAVMELLALFAAGLNDLGQWLLRRFDGSFSSAVHAAAGSAERLVTILDEMAFFQDIAQWNGVSVPFYKRAQITAADLWLAFGGRTFGAFEDIGRLTIFADNAVPHVLRVDGVLVYSDTLASRIDAGESVDAGSVEEIELRAAAVHAAELILAELGRHGRGVIALELDNYLWHLRDHDRYRHLPAHRTRTVYY